MRFLEKIFFFLLIFFLPTQIGLHLWPNWSFVAGIRVDYLSPTIYLTDLLILGILLTSFVNRGWYKKRKFLIVVTGLLVFAIINSLWALNPAASILKWGKVLELTLLACYMISSNRGRVKTLIVKALPFSIVIFALIGFLQTIFQETLGGPLYYLGERSFSATTPGIALYDIFGKLLLRPYSTFPHPNVFGAYMFLATLMFFVLKNKKSRSDYLVVLIGFLASALSGSLAVYLGAVVILSLIFLGKSREKLTKLIPTVAILLSFAFLFLSSQPLSQKFSETIEKRILLARVSATMVSKSPFLGVGFNNFIVNLPVYAAKDSSLWILQPVHNIFLLTFVETGIFGLLLLGFLFQRTLSKTFPLTLAVVFVLVTGMFDHYWLTLQQPQILFALLVGLLW